MKKVDPYSHLIKRQPTHLCFVILGGEIPFVSVQVGNSINIDRLTKELVFLQLPEHVNRLPANQSTCSPTNLRSSSNKGAFIQNPRLQTAYSVSGCSGLKYYASLLDTYSAKREHTVHQLYREPHHQYPSILFVAGSGVKQSFFVFFGQPIRK